MGTFTAKKLHKGLAEYTITRYTHTHIMCIGVGYGASRLQVQGAINNLFFCMVSTEH